MTLPAPTRSFTIPSLHDGARLECRLYHPDEQQRQNGTTAKKAAVVAHPYAPLGGCFDDPVVAAVGSELVQAGWIVGTFNLRGAGESEGRTSWTAKPELGDYISFYGFMMYYLHGLYSSYSDSRSAPSGGSPKLILAGYSYGSMLTSYLPSMESVLGLFASTAGKAATQEIVSSASQLSESSSMRGSPSPTGELSRKSTDVPSVICPSVSYLLVSPILPPVSFFTAFSLLTSGSSLDTVLQGTEIKSVRPADNLTAHRSLAIYGNDDSFTSARKLRNWSAELAEAENSRFEYREVDGAGHFWQEEDTESEMRRAIREWISPPVE